jgi:hypothetical protein
VWSTSNDDRLVIPSRVVEYALAKHFPSLRVAPSLNAQLLAAARLPPLPSARPADLTNLFDALSSRLRALSDADVALRITAVALKDAGAAFLLGLRVN